jgi:hypothetical protein
MEIMISGRTITSLDFLKIKVIAVSFGTKILAQGNILCWGAASMNAISIEFGALL